MLYKSVHLIWFSFVVLLLKTDLWLCSFLFLESLKKSTNIVENPFCLHSFELN